MRGGRRCGAIHPVTNLACIMELGHQENPSPDKHLCRSIWMPVHGHREILQVRWASNPATFEWIGDADAGTITLHEQERR